MSRRVAWAGALAGALLAVGIAAVAQTVRSAPPPPELTPAMVLKRALAAAESPPPFSGTVQVRSDLVLPLSLSHPWSAAAPAGRTLRIWHDAPDLWRVESHAAPDAPASRLTVTDGRTVMTWEARGNTYRLRRQPPASAVPLPGLGRMARWLGEADGSGTRLAMEASAQMAGRPAYHLVAEPTAGDVLVGSIQAWIDTGTFLPLQVQLTDRSGAAVLSASFDGPVAYGSSPASFFSTEPPAGATPAPAAGRRPAAGGVQGGGPGGQHPTPAQQLAAARARAGFPVAQPRVLPGGRTLSGVRSRRGRVVLRYGSAWQTLVLVESRAANPPPSGLAGVRAVEVNGARGMLVADRIMTAMGWTAGGVHYTLAASMAPEALLAVARSVPVAPRR